MKIIITLLALVCGLVAAENSPENRVAVFSGVMKVSNHFFYYVGGLKEDDGRWVRDDRAFGGNTITNYDSANQILTLKDAKGQGYTVALKDSKVTAGLSSPSEKFKTLPKMEPAAVGIQLERKPTIITDIYPPRDAIPVIDGLDWKFIESDENPMKDKPMDPSREDTQRWKTMSAEEKAEIVNMYMQHGWATTVATNNKGVFYTFKKIPIGLTTKTNK